MNDHKNKQTFRLLVITADYCVDGDSRSETSIHLDVYCRRASDYVFSVSDFWIFGRQFVWQVRGVGSFKPTPLEFGRVHCRGSKVSRSSTLNIIAPATLRMFAVLTCPDGPEKAERRVTRTSQFTSDKNPEAGLFVSSLELNCRWRTVCFGRRLTVDDFVCRCDFNITGESYRGAASGWISWRRCWLPIFFVFFILFILLLLCFNIYVL